MKFITHFLKAGIFFIMAFTLLLACSDEDDNYNFDPDNYYPTCMITNPGLDSRVVTGGRLTITVNATDYVGEVRKIELATAGGCWEKFFLKFQKSNYICSRITTAYVLQNIFSSGQGEIPDRRL